VIYLPRWSKKGETRSRNERFGMVSRKDEKEVFSSSLNFASLRETVSMARAARAYPSRVRD